MSESFNGLDLDRVTTIPVKVGGRQFEITQQSRPTLERIIAYVNDEVTENLKNKKEADETKFTELLFDNFEKQLPAIALILGYDPKTPEGKEVVTHLNNHLRPSGGAKIFSTWFDLNEIDDFFLRGGRLTVHPDMLEVARKAKEKAFEQNLD